MEQLEFIFVTVMEYIYKYRKRERDEIDEDKSNIYTKLSGLPVRYTVYEGTDRITQYVASGVRVGTPLILGVVCHRVTSNVYHLAASQAYTIKRVSQTLDSFISATFLA